MYISLLHLLLFLLSVSAARVLILRFLPTRFFNKKNSVPTLIHDELMYLGITVTLSLFLYIIGLFNQSSEYQQIIIVIMGFIHVAVGIGFVLIQFMRKKAGLLKSLVASFLLFLIPIIAGVAVYMGVNLILKQSGLERFRIEGFSMEPAYLNNTNVFVKRSPKGVKQFDPVLVIIDDRTLITRIVAEPGNTVVVTSEDIFVNQERIPTVPPTRIFKDLTATNQRLEGPRVYVTDEGIGVAIKKLQDISQSSSSSGELLDVLQGDPNQIAIQNGWFRADANAQNVGVAESISPLPGSYITWVHDPVVTYRGLRTESRDRQFPYETSLETRLELIEPLRQPSNEIVIFIDTDSGAFSYEKTALFNEEVKAVQFTLGDNMYLILNDQRYAFITDEPWQIISEDEIYAKIISEIGLYTPKR